MCSRNLSIETYSGTAGGSLSGLLAALNPGDVVQTVVLAAIGTVVCFFVSLCLNRMLRKRKSTQS